MIYKYINYERLNAVINWIKKAHEVTGEKGFSIGFDLRRGWLTSYSETTGYIIPTLYRYANLFNSSEAHDIATAAARWLVSIQNDDGSIIDYVGHRKKPQTRPPVVFNTGQDLFGLLAAYRNTGEDTFIESAKKAAKWIIGKQDKSGLWNDSQSFGSSSTASYYSHVTWPLYLIGDEVSDERIKEHANSGLERIIDRVNSNYSVKNWAFKTGIPAYTHTIAYTIEGMLEQGLLSDGIESKSFKIARNIALKTVELLERDGKFAGCYDEEWNGDFSYICMPGNCQLALIYLRLYNLLKEKQYLKAADQALLPVLKRQYISSIAPLAIRGTVPASWPPVFGKYMRWLYPNWAAKYLADALMFRMEIEKNNNNPTTDINYFGLILRYPG